MDEGNRKEEGSSKRIGDESVRKKFAEMNLLDDFLFGSVMIYPEIGKQLVRYPLKTILGGHSIPLYKIFLIKRN